MIPANQVFTKHPSTTSFVTTDWSDDLRPGETLVSVAWTVASGLTKVAEPLTGVVSTLWFSGGTDGNAYECTGLATYSSGRTEVWTIMIEVTTDYR